MEIRTRGIVIAPLTEVEQVCIENRSERIYIPFRAEVAVDLQTGIVVLSDCDALQVF